MTGSRAALLARLAVSPKKKRRRRWYAITYHECPACGRGETYRERRYTPKPKRQGERVEHYEMYDYCLDRF